MLEYVVTFFSLFFTDIFYVYYLKSVQEGKALKASCWSVVIFLIACVALINYTTDHWLLLPAAAGAFLGTYVGMIIRKRQEI
jgi:uncharacterized membrane protein YfcA